MKGRLAAYVRWRRPFIALAAHGALALVLCFIPLFGLLGYEFSLALALLASFSAGWVAAAYPHRVREQLAPYPGARWTVLRLYAVVSGLALASLALPLALISLNALRVRNCDFVEGIGFFLLGPVAAAIVASAWGLAAGLVTPGWRSASVLWVAIWLGAIGLQLYAIWATPGVRALGSFHGYFSGVLYDEDVVLPAALWSLRIRDVAVVVALLAACAWLLDRSELRLGAKAAKGRRQAGATALVATTLAVAGLWAGPVLGHRRSASDVARALGGSTSYGRCDVIHPEELSDEDATLAARDCAFGIHQLERFFGVTYSGRLTVYLFAHSGQKQELIGAGRTSVAKPWRREVYIQGPEFPHPVLRHELAHVVAGQFGARPLRVAGRLGGVLASPGLIEGAAVAADWSNGELSPHGWARAMHDLDVAPPIEDVMGLGFLGINPSRAYVLAGSFSRFLIDDRGPELFRRAYAAGDVEGVYGESVDELEGRWREMLSEVELRDGDLELARARFHRPAVFAKVCAHEVAQARSEASRCEDRGSWADAIRLRRRVLGFTNDEPSARLELARTLVAADRTSRARDILAALRSDEATEGEVLLAVHHLEADLSWIGDRRTEALESYRELLREPHRVGARRLLLVKVGGLEREEAEPFIRRFLLGGDRLGPERSDLALLTLAELVSAAPTFAIGHYLLGRQLWMRGEHERAASYLRDALRLGLPDWSLDAEARRILGGSLFRAGDIRGARRLFAALSDDATLPRGLRDEASDWVERCAWEQAQRRRD